MKFDNLTQSSRSRTKLQSGKHPHNIVSFKPKKNPPQAFDYVVFGSCSIAVTVLAVKTKTLKVLTRRRPADDRRSAPGSG